jgi:hypothetical protein
MRSRKDSPEGNDRHSCLDKQYIMSTSAKTLASAGRDPVHDFLGVRSRWPQGECASSARRDHGEWSVSMDILSPITEQPLRFVFPVLFPVHCEYPIKLRGPSRVDLA